jgi:hypothetical protein
VDLPFQIARCIHPQDVITLVNDFPFLHEEFLRTANDVLGNSIAPTIKRGLDDISICVDQNQSMIAIVIREL